VIVAFGALFTLQLNINRPPHPALSLALFCFPPKPIYYILTRAALLFVINSLCTVDLLLRLRLFCLSVSVAISVYFC